MKKSERLTQELLYLQGKTTFHLADLMETFAISKRTAVRDVQSLEELGLPLVVEAGRYGGYQILKNQLTPLYFDKNERYTLFFALQLLQKLSDSPFDRSYQGLRRKLLHLFIKEIPTG
ncbi:family transcriptional regulator [Enterococcus sp. C1]|uniref:helix-turn-helix transcriptional regulator n=1 Tax=unclassified Enterococcus TaxID=2608891 RepID=UPI000271FF41|nr:HTH domain-containing protein [Enterococcus sp. C1]EJF50240.1 family transcriptional regulator [Enterococcus sp. C1]